ncbi:MAG: hypothetical protein KF779_10565 [Hyphomonadaceae bacterium]|nr:hypothetical protein [Hyphomonadaceae bacterium]
MTLVLILVVIVVLARWGGLIFFAYACWHLVAANWIEASIAFVIACFIELVRSLASWVDWNLSGRRKWLRQRGARSPLFP